MRVSERNTKYFWVLTSISLCPVWMHKLKNHFGKHSIKNLHLLLGFCDQLEAPGVKYAVLSGKKNLRLRFHRFK